MLDLYLRKAVQAAALLAGILFVSFCVVHLAPGTPGGGAEMSPGLRSDAGEKLARLYGLDRPLPERLALWAGKMARLDLGESLIDGQKVGQKILKTLPVTLGMNGAALVLAFLIGVPTGVWMAARSGSKSERALSAAFLAAVSLPGFWFALFLMSELGVRLRLFPVSGLHSLFHEEMPFLIRAADLLWHLAMPIAVIALSGAAAVSRYVKASVRETLGSPYIRAARARGLPERQVLFNHALRNAFLPVITLVGLSVPALLGGSVVLESVFAIPGMGRLFFNAVFQRDYPVIMGILTLGAVLTLLGNMLADLAYAYADPRTRREGERP